MIEVFSGRGKKIVVSETFDRKIAFCDSPPILLVHIQGTPNSATIDPTSCASSMQDELVSTGWTIYSVDLRQISRSHPTITSLPHETSLVQATETDDGIDAVFQMIKRRKNRDEIAVLDYGNNSRTFRVSRTGLPLPRLDCANDIEQTVTHVDDDQLMSSSGLMSALVVGSRCNYDVSVYRHR